MNLGGLNSGSSGCASLANELAQEVSQVFQETKYIYSQVTGRGDIRCHMSHMKMTPGCSRGRQKTRVKGRFTLPVYYGFLMK